MNHNDSNRDDSNGDDLNDNKEEQLCRMIGQRTGAAVDKVRRVLAIARSRAVAFRDEQDYMDSYSWFRFEPADFPDYERY